MSLPIKTSIVAAASGFVMLAGLAGAQAMPLAAGVSAGDAGVTLVAQGCGPGFFRGPMGRCRPMGPRPGFFRPGPRFCPPGMHRTPFGRCRPNF